MSHLNKRMKMFLGSAVVLIAAVAALPSKGTADSADAKGDFVPKPFRTAEATADLSQGDVISRQRRRSEELTWGRNPFRDPRDFAPTFASATKTVAKGLPKLSGISTIGDERMAIIGRQIVGVGDHLESGHLVVEVSETAVGLERDGKSYLLNLEMKP